MMKRGLLISKALYVAAALAILSSVKSVAAGMERPKLVVGIVVDQMRWDYLYRYYDYYGEGGFKRLMNEGYNCENTMINYIPTVTGVGHTSLFTGSVPSIHGIADNNFVLNGKEVYCCMDSTEHGVGTNSEDSRRSPRNMLTTTIGDELKIATDFKAKVIGVSLKDRASILSAGHSANAAYWIDNSTGTFVTSSYYMKELPGWVLAFNKKYGGRSENEISYSSYGNLITFEMAKAAIEGENLGQDPITDMLTVSFSCTDKIGHKYATHSNEMRDIFVDLDSKLADMFSYLDQKVGKGQYLVFLTADHGAANNINMLKEHGIPAEGFVSEKVKKSLDEYLKQKFGAGQQLVMRISNYNVLLNYKAINELSLNKEEVKKAAIEWLKHNLEYAYVVDLERISEAPIPAAIRERLINGYNRQRNGDIQIVLNPANYEVSSDGIGRGTTHGVWNPYDSHIPFILMGWHVKPGKTNAKTTINDIAATVCAMIHIQMPNGCIGNAIEL